MYSSISVSQRKRKQPSEICEACEAQSVGSLNISTCYTATCQQENVSAATRLLPCDKPWACVRWYLWCLCEMKIWHRWSGSRIVLPGMSRWSNLGLYTLFHAAMWVTPECKTADWNMDLRCLRLPQSVWNIVRSDATLHWNGSLFSLFFSLIFFLFQCKSHDRRNMHCHCVVQFFVLISIVFSPLSTVLHLLSSTCCDQLTLC